MANASIGRQLAAYRRAGGIERLAVVKRNASAVFMLLSP
jgi:hypothetical protein